MWKNKFVFLASWCFKCHVVCEITFSTNGIEIAGTHVEIRNQYVFFYPASNGLTKYKF